MAQAYSCDRCGKLFRDYDENKKQYQFLANDQLATLCIGYYYKGHFISYDICPRCRKTMADCMRMMDTQSAAGRYCDQSIGFSLPKED